MTLRIQDTTASEVNRAIGAERHRLGAAATGMVLTLVIITNEHDQSEATRAATYSANQHPCRILVIIPRPARGRAQLDAEISVGDREGPGETLKLRLRGPLAHEMASVVLPLLLPDTPVVAWWPGKAPLVPGADPVGRLAQRRITDSAANTRPLSELTARRAGYQPGDTDLAWSRITQWRSMLATALDDTAGSISAASVSCQRGNPSGPLLAAWLRARLKVPVTLRNSRGPGITQAVLSTAGADIELTRTDGRTGLMSGAGGIKRKIPLARRELRDLVSEELRRLDADEIYHQALEALEPPATSTTRPSSRATTKVPAKIAAKPKSKPTAEPKAKPTAKKAVQRKKTTK